MLSVIQRTFEHSLFSYAFHFETLYEGQAVTRECLLDMYKDSLPTANQKSTKAKFNDNRPDRRPGCKWEECVKEDVVGLLRCRSWKMTAQKGTVWRQKVWETEGLLRTVVQ